MLNLKKLLYLVVVLVLITGCATTRKYIPSFDHEGFIRGDAALINKADIEVSIRHCSSATLKFEVTIANNTKEPMYFNSKHLVMLDSESIQHNPMSIEDVCEMELYAETQGSRSLPMDVQTQDEYSRDANGNQKVSLNKVVDIISDELEKKERDKKRKKKMAELRNIVLDSVDIIPGAKKYGFVYFHYIDTKSLTILCGIEKEVWKFKFTIAK